MTRIILILTLSLAAVPTRAEAPLRPALDLTGAEAETVGRACLGPTGRLVPCPRRPRPVT
jgi:hypothetical protein